MSYYKYEIKVERLPSDKPIGFAVLSDGVQVAVLSLREVRDALGELEKRAGTAVNEHARLKDMLQSAANILADEQMYSHARACGEAAAEIERLAALERPWLPIEGAPLDGTRVELWLGNATFRRAAYGSFTGSYWIDDMYELIHPTHYRLPSAGPKEPT